MSDAVAPSVLIMAGGTGGHVFPALATAAALRARGVSVEWLGTQRGIESRLVPAANIPLNFIQISGLRGKNIKSLLRAPWQLLRATWQAVRVIRRQRPICVLGMGGFVAGPGGLAAWLLRKPLVIHEQNAVAGTTNRLLARLARRVLQGYPLAWGGSKAQFVGNPVRTEIAELPAPEQRAIGASSQLKLLVLGGSLGAKPLNDVLPKAIAMLDERLRPQVWHQTGEQHIEGVSAQYRDLSVEAKSEAFIADMSAAYAWADIVICRAGALTVAELAAAGVGSILVPLPHAIDDHQTANAQWLVGQAGAQLLPQQEMTVATVSKLLLELHNDRAALMTMAKAARKAAKHNVAERVADICLEVAHV
jgi:UDP-N-acetylglucosamine--N-acetylmuramyl-(pentapeptide) pyrophosphoryl-undecaprenol N-acetylglucosamine transferase